MLHSIPIRAFVVALISAYSALLFRALPAHAAVRDERPARAEALPRKLVGVGVEERLGAQLPRELRFLDQAGRSVSLGELFDGRLPVLITLNYSDCPMLCSLELSGLVTALKKVDLKLGESYRAVTVSLNPKETPEIAAKTQRRYLAQYGLPEARGAWRFVVGSERSVRALARAIGFDYRFDAERNQYYHAAALVIASPTGKLMRYLYGIEFDPATLKLGLLEASRGTIGSSLDKLVLYCSAYDPKSGSYGMVASRIMTLAGLSTLGLLGSFLFVLWRKEHRHTLRPSEPPQRGAPL